MQARMTREEYGQKLCELLHLSLKGRYDFALTDIHIIHDSIYQAEHENPFLASVKHMQSEGIHLVIRAAQDAIESKDEILASDVIEAVEFLGGYTELGLVSGLLIVFHLNAIAYSEGEVWLKSLKKIKQEQNRNQHVEN